MRSQDDAGLSGPRPPFVEVDALSKAYGAYAALQDVSFRVDHGETIALLGPNGAGKTTLMKLMVGLLAPSAGRVVLGSHDVSKERRQASRLFGFLPEECPLYPDMTSAESLRFFGAARGLAAPLLQRRIGDVAGLCDIGVVLDTPIGALSKGLRQRVGLAHALLHDPDCLLLDEPSAGLDPLQARRLREQWMALKGRKTLVVSTHLIPEVESMDARVLVIGSGRLLFDGPAAALADGQALEDAFCRLVGTGRRG